MKTSEFKIGDLVTWVDQTYIDGRGRMVSGIVIGYTSLSSWNNLIQTTEHGAEAIVVHWNCNSRTNSSPLVLRKL